MPPYRRLSVYHGIMKDGDFLMSEATLAVKNINKRFSGIYALNDVSIEFHKGEIHALLGENGAGKSTLCKIISGAYTADSGSVEIKGKTYTKLTPTLSAELGIGMIYQEFNLVNEMTVYENIFLGNEIRRGPVIDKKAMIKQTEELFDRMNVRLSPYTKIRDLSVAYCQLVEIAKTLHEQSDIIIFDEPTAPLSEEEIEKLFGIIRNLRDDGATVIYISHRMDEIMRLTDKVTVMRDGCVVKTMNTADTNIQEIIRLMIGRTLDETFPKRKPSAEAERNGVPALEVRNITNKKIKDISFKLYKGEILGLSGLVGAGRTEVLRALFGADPYESGELYIDGKPVRLKTNPRNAIKEGIALVPEDRKRQGLNLNMSISSNLTLAEIDNMAKILTINTKTEKKAVDKYIRALSIKAASVKYLVSSLSGGNQQKVVVSKWLLTEGDILLFDEPTRGIDVGAKKEIYDLLDRLRNAGKAIIMVSSEMGEIIGMCDRTLVMYEGSIKGELNWEDMTQERIMRLASGITEDMEN